MEMATDSLRPANWLWQLAWTIAAQEVNDWDRRLLRQDWVLKSAVHFLACERGQLRYSKAKVHWSVNQAIYVYRDALANPRWELEARLLAGDDWEKIVEPDYVVPKLCAMAYSALFVDIRDRFGDREFVRSAFTGWQCDCWRPDSRLGRLSKLVAWRHGLPGVESFHGDYIRMFGPQGIWFPNPDTKPRPEQAEKYAFWQSFVDANPPPGDGEEEDLNHLYLPADDYYRTGLSATLSVSTPLEG